MVILMLKCLMYFQKYAIFGKTIMLFVALQKTPGQSATMSANVKVCYAKLPILVKVYIGKNPITLSSESSKVMAEDLT